MRVLLTNDDGIDSLGLKMMRSFVRSMGFADIWTVAPSGDRSASSHSVTLNKPMHLKKTADKTFALDGTPSDCVVVAMRKIFKEEKKPDLLLSGVNVGANVGSDKVYSGTVSAAVEGLFFGIPSIAISQLYKIKKENINWNTSSFHLHDCVKKILKHQEVLQNCAISINLPHNDINGVRYIKQGVHKMSNIVSHVKKDADDLEEIDQDFVSIHASAEFIDCQALREGFITVTPVGYDLTEYKVLNFLNENLS